MAALWFSRTLRLALAFGLALVTLPACSELAAPSGVMAPGMAPSMAPSAEPSYASLAAKYLQSMLKDQASYDGFAIAGPRWVHSLRGWNWLTCVHFRDHGHPRTYVLFIEDNAVIDSRYGVETDDCERQAYTPFDLMTGELGRPTPSVQPPLY